MSKTARRTLSLKERFELLKLMEKHGGELSYTTAKDFAGKMSSLLGFEVTDSHITYAASELGIQPTRKRTRTTPLQESKAARRRDRLNSRVNLKLIELLGAEDDFSQKTLRALRESAEIGTGSDEDEND